VHWGQDWTFVKWDFTVPAYYIADGALGYPEDTHVTPDHIGPWCQVNVSDMANAPTCWFSDFQLYINP